jgi:hypothetical protein
MYLEQMTLNYDFFAQSLLLLCYVLASVHHLLLYLVVSGLVHLEPSGSYETVEWERELYCSDSQENVNISYLDLKLLPLLQTSPDL